ncbi:peroxide stress protein YaaA [uncultured Thiothrix sp.]|jgi:cytoplasmic iron level regulating protein YaaA (DUF328/UPF0246 family)|uniref:peroxide stress protein YaaA n=1 Tax=uncultured Thiothrix sp. TaxID=223185 RepID=UPI00262B4002|nr:peroxide stress protein YaaA [uncultured Thiothrix sp.]HMT93217.1 peroxide stress protein YaaA [Thiolinea sp.]
MILLSPAKKLDYVSPFTSINHTQARCLEDSQILVEQLKTYPPQQLAELMHLSDELAQLNFERYAQWQLPCQLDNAKPAMFAFAGKVISCFAKRARGLMARFALQQKITQLEQILEFTVHAYAYNPSLTQHPNRPVFTRKTF